MGGMAAKEGKLPLPDDFFDVPELNTKERHYLINLAKRACKEVVYYSRRSGGPINWVHLSSEDGVEVFQGIDESGRDAKASMTYLRGCTKICATIDEIADFFRLDTPSKLTGFAQTVGKDLLDQKTLYNLAMPTEENPRHYVGVKWTAVESPSKLARNRDFCYLECHDEFIDTSGKKRGWVRSLHSIRLPCCPRLNKSHGLVRGSMYRSGFIFIESEKKGWVDAIHTLHLDIKGSAPNWLKILVMKRRIKNIAEVNKYFQLRRLGEGKLLGDLELPAKEGVQRCQSCDTKFGLFHRKWRCRKCGKVVCTSCGHHFLLDYAGVGPRKVRICNGCSESVTQGTAVDTEDQGLVRGTPKKCEETVPLYDDVMHENGRAARKLQEHEYYLKNEDARGIADMMAAKRMQQEFEHQLKLSSSRPFQNRASNSGYGRNEAEYDEHDDDEELGLPRSRSEQQRFNMEQQWRHNQFAPSGNESTHSSRTRLPSWNHRDRDYPSSRPAESSRLHGVDYDNASQRLSGQRRGSVDSIRMSLDWGADYVVTLDPTAPESERFSNGSYQSAESANTPGRRLDHGRGCDGERERYGQYAAAGAARRRLQSEMSEYSQYHGSNRYDDFTRWQPSPLGQFDSHSMTDYGRYDRAYYGGSHQRRNSFNDLEPHVFDHFGRLTQPPFSALNSRPRSDMRRRSTTDRDHLAHFMALSAMQLYNQEFGADLLVPEETRQAALQKMVAMYAEEIDRKNRASAMRHSARKRSVGEPGPGMMLDPYAAPSRLPLSPRRSPQHHFPQTVAMDSPMHYREQGPLEYQDLSDLSESAFEAIQCSSSSPSPEKKDGSSEWPHGYRFGSERPSEPRLSSPAAHSSARSHSASRSTTKQRGGVPSESVGTNFEGSRASFDLDRYRSSIMRGPDQEDDECDAFSDLISLPHLIRAEDCHDQTDESLSVDSSDILTDDQVESKTASVVTPTQSTESQQQDLANVCRPRSDSQYSDAEEPHRGWSSSFVVPRDRAASTPEMETAQDHFEMEIRPARSHSTVSSCSGEAEYFTSSETGVNTRISATELERYRASLSELLAEYGSKDGSEPSHLSLSRFFTQTQPEGEPDHIGAVPRKSPSSDAELRGVLKELYL